MVIKMKKKLSIVKTSIILVILLFSIFIIISPVNSADETTTDLNQEGGLIAFNHVVNAYWTNQQNATMEIKPFTETRNYDITFSHSLSYGPFGRSLYQVFYAGQIVYMKVQIKSYPSEWAQVTAFTDTIQLKLPTFLSDVNQYQYTIAISVDDRAPAFTRGTIVLGVSIEARGIIKSYDQDLQLAINPSYAPKLNVIADIQSKIMGPMDIGTIPIKVTNLGNGESKVYFSVANIPVGWTVLVTDQVTLSPDQTETVYMTVKPPRSFGYHDDVNTFRIEYYPAWSTDPSIKGTTEQITVAIESRGISLIGGELVLPILILIIVIIIILFYYFKKIKQK